jgi:alpha-tubulin suppressor-like RCC1 family protein
MYAFKKFPPVLGAAFLGLFLCVGAPALRAQTPSFQVAPRPTEVRTGATVGVGAVVSGSAAASYVWTKAGVVVGSGSAVAANDWKSVAAGASHTLALKNDGSLWGWGSNQNGQLALATAAAGSERRSAPTRIGSASDWAGVFASGDRSCAIKKDGTAWYWGGTAGSPGMNKVAGDQFWESAAFGGTGAMYLVSLGGVYVFRTDMGSAPSPIGTARDWASLSAWGEMVVALKRDGTLWGYDPMGAGMGQSSANGGFYSVRSGRWKAACAGPGYAVALREDGTLWAWQRAAGGNSGWTLFNNSWQMQYTPRKLGARSDWKSLAADVLPLAVDAEGRVHQVAEAWSRRIGEIPVACRGVSGRTTEKGKWNSEGLALGADGTLWAWGGNDYGQLGDLQDTTSPSGMVRYGAVQVGVHQRWRLSSPVLGVPLGLVLPNFQAGNLGVYELRVNNVAAGSVALAQWTNQPETRRLTAGGLLELAANGSLGTGAAPTYQWYRNGVAVSGATSSTYSLANAQTSASGVYWLEMTRGGVAALSESATVVVEETALAGVHTLLTTKSYPAASGALATILQATPSHPAANVLKAFTDVYLLIQDSRTTTMLTQLGFTGSADPFNFTLKHAGFPAGGALTSEARKWMKDTLYPQLKEAEVRLGNVTSTGFTAALEASDFGSTSTETIPFDYGDVQVARAGLNLVMSLLKWVETQNTDVGLLALKDKRESGGLSLESLLAMYPDLLKASATATEAQTEFVDRFGKAVSYYLNFSAFANPAPGSTGARRLDAEQALFTLTTAEDRESERRLAQDCVRLQTSLAATSAIAGLQSFSLPTSGFEGTLAVQASPWVFFKHAPGWRSELPAFKKNAYVPGTLRADTAIAFYPALKLDEIGRLEAELAAAEPGLTEWLKTGRETVPPTLQLSTLSSGAASVTLQNGAALATNGWLTVSGTVADATGVGRVMVTRTSGVDFASAVASFVERAPVAGAAARVYDWTAQLPAVVGAGTIAASAWDFSGNFTTASATVTLSAAATPALPVVPEQTREAYFGRPGELAVVVPAAGTLQFAWRRNGASLQAGTASAVDDWASVSIGGDHTAAIKRDGTLWTWGSNANGQLGAGTNRQFPERIGNGSNWASVSSGKNFTVALTRSGSLWVSGNSPFGNFQQLTAVTSLTATSQTWARVSTSDSHALALTRGGRLFVWSDGTGTAVDSGSEWAEIAAGNGRGARMNFAIKRDGTLWAWGDNTNGNLGLGWGYNGTVSSPAQVGTDRDWLTVATCTSNTWSKALSAAVKKDGTLWAWGFAPDLFPDRSQRTPRRIGPQDARWASVAVAEYSVLGTRPDGRLFEIGDDWISSKPVFANVVSAVAAGYSHGVVGADGVLWMWGWNNFGQLGNYTPQDLSRPSQDWRITYEPDPIQVGVNPNWGLPFPVRGIPVPLSVGTLQTDGLGLYNLTVTRGTSSASSVATFYTRGSVSPMGATYLWTPVGGGSLQLQGGINAGNSTVSYQWYRNGVPVPGGTSSELAVAPALGNAGVYWVQAVSGKTSIRGTAIAAVVDSANAAQARDALNARNLSLASSKLNAALAENPNDGPALFLRAVLDLYNVWSDPALATHLAALGFSGSPDPLNLTLQWSVDGFPKGALSAPVRAWLMGNLYPKMAAIEANLAKITDTGFISAFGPYDLGLQGEDSIVDYGDVQVLRALLNAGLAALKWLETQNTDVDLAALQLDRQNGRLSVESLLSKYPQLLNASATAPAAQAEFVSRFKQALDRYKAFSDFVNPAVASSVGQRQNQFIGTARLETEEDLTSERQFRDVVNKTLESINATDALAGRRTVQTTGGVNLTASPYAFFQHAPGWRSDLPKFTRNAFQRNTLNRSLLQSVYPAFTLAELSDVEDSLVRAEPELAQLLGTREDSTPPVVAFNPVNALSSYDGWVNLEGTVQDNVGVRRVMVTVGTGATAETVDAELEELTPAADGSRLYKWRVALPLFGKGTATFAFSISAEDVFGAVVDSPVVKVLPVERMVPLSVGSRGEGDLTYTVTPAADENGFVRVGAKLVLTARPKTGSLLRRIETVVDGETLPQSAYRSSTLNLTIRGETAVSAVFERNPYLLVGGRNRLAGGMLAYQWGDYPSDGSLPMSGLQVALTSSGGFSGRLRVGVASYVLAGRFDADGFCFVHLPQQFISLNWDGAPQQYKRPNQRPSTVTLSLWVDTSNGPDAPVLRADLGYGYAHGTLYPLAAREHLGQGTFTGHLTGGEPTKAPGAFYNSADQGDSELVRKLWNRTPGWWSITARKTGAAIVTGAVPGRGRYTCSGYLANQLTLKPSSGSAVRSSGDYADLQVLSSVNAETVLRLMATLYTPTAGNSSMATTSYPSASGTVRTEMWYPGNRGPVFESSAPSAVGTNAYVAFASVGTLGGVGFTPAAPGQTLAPFVTTAPSGNTPRKLAAKIGFGMGANASMSPFQRVFELQVAGRNALGVVPGSANDAGWMMPQLSLNPTTGVMSGSAMRWGKRVGLQGVLLQRTFSGGNIPSGLQNAYGVGLTSDGDPFVLTEQTP